MKFEILYSLQCDLFYTAHFSNCHKSFWYSMGTEHVYCNLCTHIPHNEEIVSSLHVAWVLSPTCPQRPEEKRTASETLIRAENMNNIPKTCDILY